MKTKKILWIYYENDFSDLQYELKNKILLKYLEDPSFSQNLHLRQDEIDLVVQEELNIQERKFQEYGQTYTSLRYSVKKFIKLFNLRYKIMSLSEYDNKRLINPEFKKIIKLAKDLADQNNIDFYFIYITEYKKYKKKLNNSQNYNDYKKVMDYVSSLDIRIIDLHKEVFEKEQNPLKLFPFELPGHYNVDGYKKVAETIYKFTKD